jgi:chaperonin GroES
MAYNDESGIRPTGGHVLVKPEKVEEVTAGGIIIPDTVRDKEQQAATKGVVVAIGLSAWKDLDDGKPWCKVKDVVLYAKYAGIVMSGVDGEDYVLLNDNDLLAVFS